MGPETKANTTHRNGGSEIRTKLSSHPEDEFRTYLNVGSVPLTT